MKKHLFFASLLLSLSACQAAPQAAPAPIVTTAHRPPLAPLEQRDKLDFAWSPDGKQIALSTWSKLLSFAPDGSGRQEHAAVVDLAPRGLAWSPDGKQIALLKKRQGQGTSETIHLLVLAGGEPKALPAPAATAGATSPVWSPDSRQLLYLSIDPAKAGPDQDSQYLGLADPAAGSARVLLDAAALGSTTLTIHSQAWSPDGKQILLTTSEFGSSGTRSRLGLLDPATKVFKPLLSEPGPFHFQAASFSPEGGRILYTKDRAIWMVQSDGSAASQLAADGRSPQWTNSGQSLIYLQDDAAGTSMPFVRNLNESAGQALKMPTGWIHKLSWSPDNQHFAVGSLQPQRDGTLLEKVYVAGLDGSIAELEP